MMKTTKVQLVQPYFVFSCVIAGTTSYGFKIISGPLITPSTRYSEWKLKMISSLKRQDLYEVFIVLGKQSYENENDWINDCDRDFGTICLALSPSLRYLIASFEYPKDLWTKLDRTFGKHNEDHNRNLEITPNTTRVLY